MPLILIVVLAAALAPVTALARQPLWFSPPQVQQNQVIYDSTVTPLPGNLPSQAFEGTGTSEFGDEITFAGSSRALQQVTVTMSSWACQEGRWKDDCVTEPGAKFSMPITFTIYNVGDDNSVGSQIATVTQFFDIPYRPSADHVNCDGVRWYNSSDNSCNNGIATNITFDFSSMAITLPDSVIYSVSFNTSSYGIEPYGTNTDCFISEAGCFYDSLNVALAPEVVVGSQANPGTAFLKAHKAGHYCDDPALGAGVFQLDAGDCWTGQVPAVQFTAGTPPATGRFAWLFNFLRQFYAFRGR